MGELSWRREDAMALDDAAALDHEVLDEGAWERERVEAFRAASVLRMTGVYDGERLVGLVSVWALSKEAFWALVNGEIESEALDVGHGSLEGGYWWVGLVGVRQSHRGLGLGRTLWSAIPHMAEGFVCADTWSAEGYACARGDDRWEMVRDGEHPMWLLRPREA